MTDGRAIVLARIIATGWTGTQHLLTVALFLLDAIEAFNIET
jgi:hypothetical protein